MLRREANFLRAERGAGFHPLLCVELRWVKDIKVEARVVSFGLRAVVQYPARNAVVVGWVGPPQKSVRWLPRCWNREVHKLDELKLHKVELARRPPTLAG